MSENSGALEYLTPPVVADFAGFGTQTLLQALQMPEISNEAAGEITSRIFTEIFMLISIRELSIKDVTEFMKLAISDEFKAITFCQVFDVFPHDDVLIALVAQLHKRESIINSVTLAQYVDSDTLVKLEVVASSGLTRQMNTRKRDELFTQKKFNLIHEEIEGYSVLANEFHSIFSSEENEFLVDHAINVVYSLIGHYLLDPNRVLDIFIDLCANNIVGNHRFIISFLKKSPWWPDVEGTPNNGLKQLNVGGNPAVMSSIALRLLKQASDREVSETFKILIALFIREGLVSFGQIYPCLSPSEEEMIDLEATYNKELEEKVSRASASALALAAPLAEEDSESNGNKIPTFAQSAKRTVATMIVSNMKFQMLKCFLGTGLYWPAVYILSHYPFLVHVDSEISDLMHRMLTAIINPLHSTMSSFTTAQIKGFQEMKCMPSLRSSNKMYAEESAESYSYCFNPITKNGANRMIYFMNEWSENLPVFRSSSDLIVASGDFIKFFGPTLAFNSSNFIKLCEIVVGDLRANSDENQKKTWLSFFRNYILPNIAFIGENAIPVDKAYEILTFFPVEDRFNLYGELNQVMAKTSPYVKIAYGTAEKATKDILKRLSKENVEPMMRRLAKISLSNPLPCFLTMLQQLESYDNLNSLVVDTAESFNAYGWDNITLAIMMRLTSVGRSSKQANGLNERQWIQSLSSFVGKLCQRYPAKIDLTSLLNYLISSFHSSGSADLIVLKEMLSSMGGIQSTTNLTELQIDMINCEPTMQKIVYKTIGDRRYEYRQSGMIMRDALMHSGCINEILVLLCNINKEITDTAKISHLKVLTSARDELSSVLQLLCTLVGFFGDDHSNLLTIDVLIKEFDVPSVWAFELWRNLIPKSQANKLQFNIESAMSENYFQAISSKFYVSFWLMSLYDLNYASDVYDNESIKLKSRIISLKEEYGFLRRDKHVTPQILRPLKQTISEMELFISSIPIEKERHETHAKAMNEFLIDELSSEFSLFSKVEAESFLQLCVLPRAIHSSFDAIYSAKFLFKLQSLRVNEFSLMTTLNVLFRNHVFFATLFTCTPVEAENLGIFVSTVLKELILWTKEGSFPDNILDKGAKEKRDATVMTVKDFRMCVFEYHSLLLEDISRALQVTTYMSRMNAITFLKNLLGIYPIVEDHCELIIDLIYEILQREDRDDLKLSSSALLGHVKSRKSTWVHLWDFIELSESDKAVQMIKRKEIEDREAHRLKEEASKREEAQRAQERILQENERKNRDAATSDIQKGTNAATINYDDRAKPAERVSSRTNVSAKGRYDNYTQDISEGPASQKLTQIDELQSGSEHSDKSSAASKVTQSKFTVPTGPSRSNSRQSTPEAVPKSRDERSGQPVKDLFEKRQESSVTKAKEPTARISQLRSRLESARKDFKGEVDKYETRNRMSHVGEGSSGTTSRSVTPAGPSQTRTAPSSSSSTSSQPLKSSLNRAPLPPQRPPSNVSSYEPSRSAGNESRRFDRTPSVSQAAPKDGVAMSNASVRGKDIPNPQQSQKQSTRVQSQPSASAGRTRVPLPPQQPPREKSLAQLESRSLRNVTSEGRDTKGRSDGRLRRPSGDPLPPPNLPPPARKESPGANAAWDRKRRYGDNNRYSDKRSRY